MYHPGVPIVGEETRDLNNVLLRIHALLERASRGQLEGMATYLYDATETTNDPGAPLQFLGGSQIVLDGSGAKRIDFYKEDDSNYDELPHGHSGLKYEEEVEVGGRVWKVVVLPVDDSFEPNLFAIILSGCLIAAAALALAVWMLHNMRRSIQMQEVMAKAAAEAAIVSNLFPENVKQRLLEDAAAKGRGAEADNGPGGFHHRDITQEKLAHYLTVEGIFGSKPIAELYPSATLFFADLVGECHGPCLKGRLRLFRPPQLTTPSPSPIRPITQTGFTAWSSVRDPSQVFTLLEVIYHSFDNIAKRRKIFKGMCLVSMDSAMNVP